MSFYGFVLGTLGVWRVTYLLHAEDGPGDLLLRARQRLTNRFLTTVVGCFYCLSIWVAIPFALLVAELDDGGWSERLLLWPALSAGSILLERLTTRPISNTVTYQEDPKED